MSKDKEIWEKKLKNFLEKASAMLHHNKDKKFLEHIKTHAKCPETVYYETTQLLEAGRLDTQQTVALLATALTPEQLTQMHKAAGQKFFGHTRKS